MIAESSPASTATVIHPALTYFLAGMLKLTLDNAPVNTDKAALTVKPDTTASTASTFTSTIASTAPTRRCCPKCGAEAEAGDDFCIYCGAPLRK